MNRLDRIFEIQGTGSGRRAKVLMPFVTAGDPDLATTAKLLPAMEAAGAGVVEVGIPFSDPIADGPVIQASMTRALEGGGLHIRDVLEVVAELRPRTDLGLVAMVSYSIVHRLGVSSFVREALEAGFDGFIFPDLLLEESGPVRDVVEDADGRLSMLIAPTTSTERAQRIAKACSGFVYVLSRAGLTGERKTLPQDLPERLRLLRAVTDLPIAVGFGISNRQQVRQVVTVADAVIVGSAIMRRVADHRSEGSEAVVRQVATFTGDLAAGLPGPEIVAR